MKPVTRQFLFIQHHAPFLGAQGFAGMDMLMTAAVFDQAVSLLFLGEGVLHLLKAQDGQLIGSKTLAKNLPALELYDVHSVLAETAALERYAIDDGDLLLPITRVSPEEVKSLITSAELVFTC